MIIYFIIFILTVLLELKSSKNSFFDKTQTTSINGVFIIIVFFSHFFGYYENFSGIDYYFRLFIGRIGQLMVTTFFFFSGYGIYEQIKSRKNYLKNFIKTRFLPTYINFVIGVSLYLFINIIIKADYSLSDTLLSYTGFTTIGNSNWYMFSIFMIYLILVLLHYLFKDRKMLLYAFSITMVLYAIIINIIKGDLWASTILVFPFGMWVSNYNDNIYELFYKKMNTVYFVLLFIFFIVMYILSCKLYYTPFYIFSFNITSFIFISLIIFFMKYFTFKEKGFLHWCGKKIFWIYIIQRLPMIVLLDLGQVFRHIFSRFLYCI